MFDRSCLNVGKKKKQAHLTVTWFSVLPLVTAESAFWGPWLQRRERETEGPSSRLLSCRAQHHLWGCKALATSHLPFKLLFLSFVLDDLSSLLSRCLTSDCQRSLHTKRQHWPKGQLGYESALRSLGVAPGWVLSGGSPESLIPSAAHLLSARRRVCPAGCISLSPPPLLPAWGGLWPAGGAGQRREGGWHEAGVPCSCSLLAHDHACPPVAPPAPPALGWERPPSTAGLWTPTLACLFSSPWPPLQGVFSAKLLSLNDPGDPSPTRSLWDHHHLFSQQEASRSLCKTASPRLRLPAMTPMLLKTIFKAHQVLWGFQLPGE